MIDRIRVEPGHEPRIAERNPRDTLGLEDKADANDRLVRLHERLEKLDPQVPAGEAGIEQIKVDLAEDGGGRIRTSVG
jgi:hypothetical protein